MLETPYRQTSGKRQARKIQEIYKNVTDEDLVSLAKTGDELATESILKRYKNFVRHRARSYFLKGGDIEDLVQEGVFGLYKAIRDYNPVKTTDNGFRSFADLCIVRQLITAVKTYARQKHIPLNNYVSLQKQAYGEGEKEITLGEILTAMDISLPILSNF